MNKKLSGILGIILSILILVYFEPLFYKLISITGFNIDKLSTTSISLINLGIKLIMCFLIFLIYKKDFRKRRNTNNIFKMLLILVIGVFLLTLIMYLFNYIIKYLADIFNIEIIEKDFYNIFDKKITFNLIIKIINDYLIIPFLYTSTILLSVDKLTRRHDTFILISALLSSVIYGITLNGTLIFIIINSLPIFIIFGLLSFCYKRFNSIWLVTFIYSFYLLSNVLILNLLHL